MGYPPPGNWWPWAKDSLMLPGSQRLGAPDDQGRPLSDRRRWGGEGWQQGFPPVLRSLMRNVVLEAQMGLRP
jgi:hypothetical protein